MPTKKNKRTRSIHGGDQKQPEKRQRIVPPGGIVAVLDVNDDEKNTPKEYKRSIENVESKGNGVSNSLTLCQHTLFGASKLMEASLGGGVD